LSLAARDTLLSLSQFCAHLKTILFPERDYVTFGYLLSSIRMSVCL